jgi:hypothetical protein
MSNESSLASPNVSSSATSPAATQKPTAVVIKRSVADPTPPPLPPLPQNSPPRQIETTSKPAATSSRGSSSDVKSSFNQVSLTGLKPIDSVDSVAGLLLPKSDSRSGINTFASQPGSGNNTSSDSSNTAGAQSTPSQIKINFQNRFSNIEETDVENRHQIDNDNKRTTKNLNDNFSYGSIQNDNDTTLYKSSSSINRIPITPVINHYEFKRDSSLATPEKKLYSTGSLNRNAPNNTNHLTSYGSGASATNPASLSGSSISIKIQTHSPVHLKTTSQLNSGNYDVNSIGDSSTSKSTSTWNNHSPSRSQPLAVKIANSINTNTASSSTVLSFDQHNNSSVNSTLDSSNQHKFNGNFLISY